ncbi:MAG: DUF5668 domain-containing protein [Vicinamibacterales bacterium]
MTSPLFENPQSMTPRLLGGLGLMLFGAVMLIDRTGLMDAGRVLRFWPLILIAIGVQQLAWGRSRADGTSGSGLIGLVWIAVGGVFLLNSLGITHASVFELFWPLLLMGVGVRLLTHSGRAFRRGDVTTSAPESGSRDAGPAVAVLSGVKRVSPPDTFKGLDVTLFMGGAQLDYRPAILAPGAEAVIDIVAIMGGCEIFVPPHWVVSAPATTILGGIDDQRVAQPSPIIDHTSNVGPPPRLVIRGLVLMGGITIRS